MAKHWSHLSKGSFYSLNTEIITVSITLHTLVRPLLVKSVAKRSNLKDAPTPVKRHLQLSPRGWLRFIARFHIFIFAICQLAFRLPNFALAVLTDLTARMLRCQIYPLSLQYHSSPGIVDDRLALPIRIEISARTRVAFYLNRKSH